MATSFSKTQKANKRPGVELAAANRLYAHLGFQMKPKFVAVLQDSFSADNVQQLNFARSIEAAKEINGWVGKITKGRIKDLITAAVLNGSTRLVLVSGAYFKGLWKNPFNRVYTMKAPFHVVCDGGSIQTEEVEVDMMHMRKNLLYAKLKESHVVGLPYQVPLKQT